MENGHIQITFKYHGECTNTIIQVSLYIQRCVHPLKTIVWQSK